MALWRQLERTHDRKHLIPSDTYYLHTKRRILHADRDCWYLRNSAPTKPPFITIDDQWLVTWLWQTERPEWSDDKQSERPYAFCEKCAFAPPRG